MDRQEMYNKSPLFNKAVQMLVSGQNEFDVLADIINSVEIMNRAFEEYIIRDTRPSTLLYQQATQK